MAIKIWRKISVASDEFDALMRALERAESKGYLPDAIAEEWANFDYEEVECFPAAELARPTQAPEKS